MLPPSEWLKAAQALPEGSRSRIDHVCGDGRTLLLTHEPGRWTAFCFRCDDHGVEQKPAESWQERLARITKERQVDGLLERCPDLPGPPDFDVRTWPIAAQAWLYKAGCGLSEIEELGAYWHAPSGRVVLPIFDDGKLLYWQGRDPAWARKSRRQKYINPHVGKQRIVARYGRGDPLVLTEDVLSAFRVGQHTEAWSIMGTKLPDSIAASVPDTRRVLVWLDPDPPGRRAARTITKQLNQLGIQARRVESRADPKCLSRREINGLLGLSEDTPP